MLVVGSQECQKFRRFMSNLHGARFEPRDSWMLINSISNSANRLHSKALKIHKVLFKKTYIWKSSLNFYCIKYNALKFNEQNWTSSIEALDSSKICILFYSILSIIVHILMFKSPFHLYFLCVLFFPKACFILKTIFNDGL